jgi:hypothetical protein
MLSEIRYSPNTNRYRVFEGAGKGQFISKKAFNARLKDALVAETEKFLLLADRLYSTSDVKSFELEAAKALRALHTGQAILGADGWENMTSRRWLMVARTLKEQYGLTSDFGLRYLADDFVNGKLSQAQFKARLGLFAKGSKQSYFLQEAENNADKPFAKRVLGVAEHCPECLQYASMGVVAKNLLPKPTELCSCRMNCACRINYYSLEELGAAIQGNLV